MAILTTILQLALVWLGACAMGFAVVRCLLPEDIAREHGAFVMPTAGVLAFCILAFTISATFGVAAAGASWLATGLLVAAAIGAQFRPRWRIRPREAARDLRLGLVLMAPMALFILSPLFHFGADGYLGSVNPDFFAGLVDEYYLLKGHSIATFETAERNSWYPVESAAGYLSASARFGSELFAIALHLLLRVDSRTAMALTIGFSMLCLPLTLYSFCRVVMAFEPRPAKLAAWLIGISAPVAMSYLYFYLGQNAGLPALPLVLMAAYLMLVRPGLGTTAFCAIVANALFVNYFAMLPYALAPAGPLAVFLLATGRLPLRKALLLGMSFAAISLALVAGHMAATMESMRMWLGVIGQSLQGQYFLDFLTESFFSYFLGIYNYQASPWAVRLLGPIGSRFAGFGVAIAVLAVLLMAIRRWVRENPLAESRVFIVSALLVYTGVWALYSFSKQYGYAVFKMSSWLQFIVVPFMGYAIHRLLEDRANAPRAVRERIASAAVTVVLGFYVALNLAADLQYAYNGLGRNKDTGYIVNHFGMSGNRDFHELPGAVARHVRPDESIGLLFTDSIRNWWTSYYIKEYRQSLLSHSLMPGDDENLPDVESNVVMDYYGNVEKMHTEFFHGGASDQYILTWNAGDLNRDIVTTEIDAKPLWANDSFRLFRAADVRDLLITGRGYYRLEYFKPIREYFFPQVLRWSADGGEFYLLRPSRPGEAYRLAFDAIVGYEYPNDSRTLEFYLDGRKFHETTITHSARVVSAPFVPRGPASRLVVHIKEKNKPLSRPFALWNKDIPADYRRMNVAFSNARIIPPGGVASPPAEPGRRIEFLPLLSMAEEFNGFQLDGWTGDLAQVTLAAPAAARTVEIAGFAPGNLGFVYPYEVKVRVNGRESVHSLAVAGDFKLQVTLAAGEPSASITILPGQSRELGEVNIRHKVIRRSLRIDALTFH